MLGMPHEGHKNDLESVFWRHFDEAWEKGGFRSAEHASTQLRTRPELKYQLAPATIRDWCKHRRLPRNEDDFKALCCLLVGDKQARVLVDELQAVQAHRMTAKRDKEDGDGDGDDQAKLWIRVWQWKPSRYIAGGVGALVVTGVILWLVVPSDEKEASASPSLGGPSGSVLAEPDQAVTCPGQIVRGESKEHRASATYCRERHEFLLSDDRGDQMSAILVVRVNGDERPAWFNSNGYQTRTPDGKLVRVPPKPVPLSLKAGDVADFRVCYGHKTADRTYSENTCGDWTPFWPAR